MLATTAFIAWISVRLVSALSIVFFSTVSSLRSCFSTRATSLFKGETRFFLLGTMEPHWAYSQWNKRMELAVQPAVAVTVKPPVLGTLSVVVMAWLVVSWTKQNGAVVRVPLKAITPLVALPPVPTLTWNFEFVPLMVGVLPNPDEIVGAPPTPVKRIAPG